MSALMPLKAPLPLRPCGHCGTRFSPRDKRQLNCSPACTAAHKNQRKAALHARRAGLPVPPPATRRVRTVFDRDPALLAECKALLDAALESRKGGANVRGAAKTAQKRRAA